MTTDVSEDDRAWQEDEDQGLSDKSSVIPTKYARSVGAYTAPRPGHPNQQYPSNLYRQFNRGPFVEPAAHLPFPPRWTPLQIIHIGEGMTVAGQSSEDFATRFRVSLCYQCCKRYVECFQLYLQGHIWLYILHHCASDTSFSLSQVETSGCRQLYNKVIESLQFRRVELRFPSGIMSSYLRPGPRYSGSPTDKYAQSNKELC